MTVAYCLGFTLAMNNRSWWALPTSLGITFAFIFIFAAGRKLMEIWGIGYRNVENMTRQQRRAYERASNKE